jgi:hypothetical protein
MILMIALIMRKTKTREPQQGFSGLRAGKLPGGVDRLGSEEFSSFYQTLLSLGFGFLSLLLKPYTFNTDLKFSGEAFIPKISTDIFLAEARLCSV